MLQTLFKDGMVVKVLVAIATALLIHPEAIPQRHGAVLLGTVSFFASKSGEY